MFSKKLALGLCVIWMLLGVLLCDKEPCGKDGCGSDATARHLVCDELANKCRDQFRNLPKCHIEECPEGAFCDEQKNMCQWKPNRKPNGIESLIKN
ncbi:hypothetical protein Ddc_16912 [Ditylenchus destructor]|nr:hypothetical protein Ddc_16912 [Ditylenchus destructor]